MRSHARRWIEQIIDARPGELAPVLCGAACFFCLLFAYFMLRPLREAMGLEAADGVEGVRLLFLGTLGVMLLVNIGWAAIVARLPRRAFIALIYRGAIVCLALFLVLRGWAGPAIGAVFYVWLSVFNVLAVSIFWQLMVDVFALEQARRLFGFIAVGGTAGAIAGSAYAWQLAEAIGPTGLIISAAVLLEATVQLSRRASRTTAATGHAPAPDPPAIDQTNADERPIGGSAWSGLVRTVRSPLLRGVSLYLLISTVLATLLYFEKLRIVAGAIDDRDQRAATFALIELVGQSATVLIQVFLTGRLMRWLGIGALLAALPAIFMAGFAVLAVRPTLLVVTLLDAGQRAGRHALARPAREAIFTIVSRDEKYKAKSIVDTVVYRGGDVLGALADMAVATAGAALLALPLAGAGIAIAAWLGRFAGARKCLDAPSARRRDAPRTAPAQTAVPMDVNPHPHHEPTPCPRHDAPS